MRRNALGIVAAFLLLIGGVSAFGGPGGEAAQQFSGVCIKSGLVLGALWLALPQITATLARAPRWLLSWFVGEKKELRPKEAQPGAKPESLAQPQPRPRRRSNR
jgi:hypothetical protein